MQAVATRIRSGMLKTVPLQNLTVPIAVSDDRECETRPPATEFCISDCAAGPNRWQIHARFVGAISSPATRPI